MEIKKIVPAKRLNISLSTGILIRKIGRDSNANIIGLIQFANGYERMVLNFIVVNCHDSIHINLRRFLPPGVLLIGHYKNRNIEGRPRDTIADC